jgi:hypothetical protein
MLVIDTIMSTLICTYVCQTRTLTDMLSEMFEGEYFQADSYSEMTELSN